MEHIFGPRGLLSLATRDSTVTLAGAPPGTVINYVDPPTRGPVMVGVSISMVSLATIVIFARIYTKNFVIRSFDWSDYFAIGALLTAITRTVVNCVAVYRYGLGRHVWDVRPEHFAHIRNSQFIMDMVYLVGIMWAKISILLLYVKVFHIRRRFRWFCYFMMAITSAYCTTFFFIYAFDCKPVYYNWHFDPMHYDCIDITHVKMATGAVNILTDLIIVLMPLPLVLQLHLAKAQKVGLFLVFSTGFFILITTIVREVFVVRTSREFDQPWSVTDEVTWLTVELNVGIICVTMPVLAPIWRKAIACRLGLSYIRSLLSSARSTKDLSKLSGSDSTGALENNDKGIWTSDISAVKPPRSAHSDQVNLMDIRVKREISQV